MGFICCGRSKKGKRINWMPKIKYTRLSDRLLVALLGRARISYPCIDLSFARALSIRTVVPATDFLLVHMRRRPVPSCAFRRLPGLASRLVCSVGRGDDARARAGGMGCLRTNAGAGCLRTLHASNAAGPRLPGATGGGTLCSRCLPEGCTHHNSQAEQLRP